MTCPFCEIVEGDQSAEILLETKDFLCILDKYPVNEGHSLVIPKRHVERLEELDDLAIYDFIVASHAEVKQRFNPDSTNIGINNGPAAGQTISHLHWHIIPRYYGDIDDPRGGVRGVIPSEQKY